MLMNAFDKKFVLDFYNSFLKKEQETLGIVTIAMIYFNLLHFKILNFSGGLYITQLNIYDGGFIAKIVSRYLQKSSIVDMRLVSKYASAF